MIKRESTVLSKEEMVDKIIHEAFKKAEKECSSEAKNALAKHISQEIENSHGLLINHRTLVRAYDKSVQSDGEKNIGSSQETVNAFCNYLGYENYKSFVDAQKETALTKQEYINEIEGELPTAKQPRSKWFLSTSLIVIIGILGLLLFKVSGIGSNVDSIANQCLYWEVDRYRPIDCDEELPQAIAKTKVTFDETLYTNFRKVSNTEMKTYASSLWQGNSPKGEIEYFTSDGVHPFTQKRLIQVEKVSSRNATKKGRNVVVNSSEKKVRETIGILIFENQNLDLELIGRLERTFFNNYGAKGGLIPSTLISESKKSQLLAGNFSSLNETRMIGLDYICVGKVNYTIKQASLSSETFSCRLSLVYDVFSSTSGIKQNELSQSKTVSAIGFSKEEAKANAIKKL